MEVSPRGEPDGALMQRVCSDDEGALGVLVQRHWAPLVSYTTRIVGTLDAAEDVVQATLVRLWEARGTWTPGGSLGSYLFRTARHLSLGRIRQSEARRRLEPEVRRTLEKTEPSPLDAAAKGEVREALRQALDRLPARRREALILVRLQGLSLGEAAERMGLSRQTVANHISLALDDLRDVLRRYSD